MSPPFYLIDTTYGIGSLDNGQEICNTLCEANLPVYSSSSRFKLLRSNLNQSRSWHETHLKK